MGKPNRWLNGANITQAISPRVPGLCIMETVGLVLLSSCFSVAIVLGFLLSGVVGYNAIMWFLLTRDKQVRARAPQSVPLPPQETAPEDVGGRNPYFQPVMVLEGQSKGFYGVLKFVPESHKPSMAVKKDFMRATNGDVDYRIITEQSALEQGRRFGGFVYVTELSVPKVV